MQWFKDLFGSGSDPLKEFREACETAISMPKSSEDSDPEKFGESLSQIRTDLTRDLSNGDCICLNYFIENNVLDRIADSVTAVISPNFAEPILTFFSRFVAGPDLDKLIEHVAIHRAVSNFITKLEILDRIRPKETLYFFDCVWVTLVSNPVIFDLLVIQTGDVTRIPILDFVLASAMNTSESGRKARGICERAFRSPQVKFANYLRPKLISLIRKFLLTICQFVDTITFDGSMQEVIGWCQHILDYIREFPIESLLEEMTKILSVFKLQSAIAFFLENFQMEPIYTKLIEFCIQGEFFNEILESCKAESERRIRNSLNCLVHLMKRERPRRMILPAVCQNSIGIDVVVPSDWLGIECGPVESETICLAGCRDGGENNDLYPRLLCLLSKYWELEVETCISLTKLLTDTYSMAPDLVNYGLQESLRLVLACIGNTEPRRKMNLEKFTMDVYRNFEAVKNGL